MDHSNLVGQETSAVLESPLSQDTSYEAMVRLENIYKRLGGKQILAGAYLDIQPGETRVVMGRSGEGKSVLLKHICGLMQPDQGLIYVEGEEISRYNEKQLFDVRRKIGVLFQNAALFDSLNVLQNVGFPLYEEGGYKENEIRDRVVEVLRLVRLGDILDKMPSELSGGMRKRVGLARAIIRKPKIILYDEPTTGLDPVTSDAINDLINSLAHKLNVTSIVITHDMASAFKVATKMAMLFEGKIIFDGTPDEIRASDDELLQQFIQGKSEGPLANM